MNTQATLDCMQKMKLDGMASSYKAIIDLPADAHPHTHECVATLIDAELQSRAHKKTSMLIRLSKLRYRTSLQDIIYNDQRGLSKQMIATLADCSFIDRAQNILITGATGCGKSYLACALGHQACLLGYRTLYFNMNRLVEQLSIAKIEGTYIKWINRLAKASLIILDDFGLQPLTHQVKMALLQIFEDRYAKNATIIASQLPIKSWYTYIDDDTIADAIMDRITANANRINLTGKSLRKSS